MTKVQFEKGKEITGKIASLKERKRILEAEESLVCITVVRRKSKDVTVTSTDTCHFYSEDGISPKKIVAIMLGDVNARIEMLEKDFELL